MVMNIEEQENTTVPSNTTDNLAVKKETFFSSFDVVFALSLSLSIYNYFMSDHLF